MKNALKTVVILSGLLALNSCATYHSPLSRELTTSRSLSPHHAQRENSPQSVGQNSFDWPVDRARMTRGFLPNKKRPHLGLDLAASKGTPILASASGRVIYSGQGFSGYGKMILIDSGNGWAHLYAHFNRLLVAEGQYIRQGEVLGEMGRTGRATGVHLHFEIRRNKTPIDPLPLLPRISSLAVRQK